MKILIIITTAILISFSMFSQTNEKTDAMLFGDVKCKGEHIPYINILVERTNMGTMTDGTGHYKLANLPVGEITIIAHGIGYITQEKVVEMKAGKATELFFELEEDVLQLEQVVVTGTKTEHYVKNVPVRTEVITSKAIETKNANNLFEVLEGIPGIRVEKQCQFCDFSMVRMQGLGAEHTQVLINGQPMYSGLAGVYGLQQISANDIDRVEIVKGAGSALYGSSAVAGAINIITKEPSYVPTTKVGLQFGNYNTNRYNISSSIRNEKGNIGLNIFAQKLTGDAIDETSDGLTHDEVKNKDGISDRVSSNLNNAGFGLYINDLFSKNDKLIIRGRYLNEKRQGGTMNDDYYKNPLTDGTECITTDRYESELSYNKKFKNNSDINFSLAYANHNRDATNDSYLGDYMSTHNDSVPDLREMRPYLANENSITGTLTYGIKIKNHHLLIGTQNFYNKLKESGMYVVVDPASQYIGSSYKSTSNKSASELGIFIQNEWKLNDKLTIVPGVRYDIHNSSEEYKADKQVFETTMFPKNEFNETSINPRIALKYNISKNIILRANAGTGFRSPYGFSEDLHLCSGSPRVWKSTDLKPETSVSYNLSADYYGYKIRSSINIFRTDLKDKIAFTDAEADVAALGYDYQWKNIDNAFVQGIEVSVMTNLIKDLDLGFDFTYNQGEYNNAREDWTETEYAEQSKYISRFPATTGNIKLEYSPKDWSFAISGNYQGEMYIDYFNEEIDPVIGDQTKIKKTDPFMLCSARVSKTIKGLKLYAGANNIFNYTADEKHTDDAAFMYAPVYGIMYYGGISIAINH
ncbi:MAG: TonB-dependent receptor [Bacteroidales bacterium]|nr:TonB-dependent receptor [Bacteroidales bacterium]